MNCPHCNSSWQGEKVPDEHLMEGEVGPKYYGRQIGIDGGGMRIYDGLVAWQCPDCGRYSPISGREVLFDKFMKLIGEEKK